MASPDAASRLSESRPLGRQTGPSWLRVTAFLLDPAERAWLEAVGIGLGEQLTVLRRAPFGGPLHVRTAGGAELAVDRAVAARIEVAPADAESDGGARS